jgi:hypothetical protein
MVTATGKYNVPSNTTRIDRTDLTADVCRTFMRSVFIITTMSGDG